MTRLALGSDFVSEVAKALPTFDPKAYCLVLEPPEKKKLLDGDHKYNLKISKAPCETAYTQDDLVLSLQVRNVRDGDYNVFNGNTTNATAELSFAPTVDARGKETKYKNSFGLLVGERVEGHNFKTVEVLCTSYAKLLGNHENQKIQKDYSNACDLVFSGGVLFSVAPRD